MNEPPRWRDERNSLFNQINQNMNAAQQHGINHDEIARLAYFYWQQDGGIHGRDQAYWLEAEHQLKATKHLLARDIASQPNGTLAAKKAKPMNQRKTSARAEPIRCAG